MSEASPSLAGAPTLRSTLIRRLVLLGVPAVVMALVWQVTPLRQLLDPDMLAHTIGTFRDAWWSPLLVVATSVAGLLLMVPLTLVVIVHGATFGLPLSLMVAEVSMLAAATALYFVGRRAGEGVVERIVPDDMRAQLDNTGAQGVLGLAALRWIPVAHFGLLCVALGALRVPWSRYLLSTLLGQTPMIVLWVVLGDRIRAGLINPNLQTFLLLFGVMVSIVLFAVATRMVLRWRKTSSA